VIIAPLLQRKYGSIPTLNMMLFLLAIVLAVMGFGVESQTTLVVAIVIAGAILGIINTVLTTAVMDVAPVERAVASSAYSFVRFSGGAIAPWLAGKLAEWYSPHVPFYAGAVAVIVSILVLAVGKKVLAHVN
jgi:ACDE family multidrug resistance protein